MPDVGLGLGGQAVDLGHVAALMAQMAGMAEMVPNAPGPLAPRSPAMPGLPSALGSGGPAHPLPPNAGVSAAESWLLPGGEMTAPASAALREGQDPSLLDLDLLPLYDRGRPVPMAMPRGAGPATALAPAPEPGYYFLPQDTQHDRRHPHAPRGPLIRDDFPLLQQRVNGHRLVWLDSAATTQKPNLVIDTEAEFYRRDNSNVHRGAHTLAKRATEAYETARRKVQVFLGAAAMEEIVFVRGATEGINLIAQSLGRQIVGEGDEIIVSHLEHHSNIVPWQMLCRERKAVLRVAPVDDNGDIDMPAYQALLGPRTRIVALTQVSNVLGTLVPIAPMTALAHRHGAVVVVDGAQSVAHVPVDVRCLDVDFFVFSGHKLYAPTGIGAVYGKKALLDAMPPWQGGGSMIESVSFEHTTYAPVPAKFEAGTGHFAGAVGLGAAIDYLEALGRDNVAAHEQALVGHAVAALRTVPGLRLLGAPSIRIGALPFVIEGLESTAVARFLDSKGIAVRAGHHCAQPILRRFGLDSSVRASLGVYSAHDDIDALVDALCELTAARGRAIA